MPISLTNTNGTGGISLINTNNSGRVSLATNTAAASVSGLVSDNLFMHLDASDYTSGTWLDRTINGNNATISGSTWLSDNGGIFDFDGVNDAISIPHTANLSLSTTSQRTIQVWVKFDALPASSTQGQPVFGKLSSNFGFDGYWGGLFSNAGNTRVVTNGTSIQRVTDSSSGPIAINVWYLYTFISQITSTSNTTKVYINTTEISTTAHGSDSYNETNPLYLGFIGTGVSSPYLNGKIGACYFYTKGLSAAEILSNYNATSTKYESPTLYSNFEQYIVNGVRQATTTALIRTNISAARRLVVTDNITITGFKFVRIPNNNWSTISYTVTGTLSVVSGTGATIDGGVSNKSFNTKSTFNNPSVVAERANSTSEYDIYDVRPNDNSTTSLTPGEYNITLLGTGANMDMAILTGSLFPIDTTKKIYPSTTAATTHFAMQFRAGYG